MPKFFQLFAVFFVIIISINSRFYGQEEESFTNSVTTNGVSSAVPARVELPPFTSGFQYGSFTINNTNYNTFRLQPEYRYGDFGIGLDLNFEYNVNGHLIESEWNSWQAIVTKVAFIRYGSKMAPVFLETGGIKSRTLGNGFILRGFSNMQNYPVYRVNGIVCDLDFQNFGINAFSANVLTFDISGMRGYYRPLLDWNDSLFQKLEIGATAAADMGTGKQPPSPNQPYDYTYSFKGQPAVAYGVDISQPWIDNKFYRLKSYIDFAGIAGKGTGESLGLSGKVFAVVPYKLEFRFLQPKFTPSYFDVLYYASRAEKLDSLDAVSNSSIGWLFGTGVSLFEDRLVLFCQVENLIQTASKPTLILTLDLARDLLKMISIEFSWLRKNVSTFGEILTYQTGDSVFSLDLEYYLSDHVQFGLIVKKSYSRSSRYVPADDSQSTSGGGLINVVQQEELNAFVFTMLATRFSF